MTTDDTKMNTSNAKLNQQPGGDPYGSIYQCPVQCEGGKTYDQPLNCPVCNEKLVLVGKDQPEPDMNDK